MTRRDAAVDAAIPETSMLGEMAGVGYGDLMAVVLEEASRPENIGVEVALLRQWLRETLQERPFDREFALKLVDRVIRAVATKYRLGPARTDSLSQAFVALADHMHEIVNTEVEV